MSEFKVGQCFRVNETDHELASYFPELVQGIEFKVEKIEVGGITAIQLKDGRRFAITDEDEPFIWCFWAGEHLSQLQLITPFEIKGVPSTFDGKPIVSQLRSTAAQENCDGWEYNLMQAASDYIEQLEKQLEFSDRPF